MIWGKKTKNKQAYIYKGFFKNNKKQTNYLHSIEKTTKNKRSL